MKGMARILLAVLVIACGAAGQESAAGFKAGVALSLSHDEGNWFGYNSTSKFLGLKVGLFWAQKISPVFSIQPEVNFARLGITDSPGLGESPHSFHFDYLEFPLLLSVRAPGDGLEFFAGPYIAVLIGHSPFGPESVFPGPFHEPEGHDFGICHGARIWWHDLSLEVHFQRGFINVFPDAYPRYYNSALVFQVACRLIK